MRLRSSSWARRTSSPERRRSFSSRSSMRLKVAASRSMSVETPGHVGVELEPPPGAREVDPLHHRQQPLERLEPAPQQQRVEQEGQHQRHRQHQELPALVRDREVESAGEDRDEDARRDHQQVEGDDLAEQRGPLHGFTEPRTGAIGVAPGADSGPDPIPDYGLRGRYSYAAWQPAPWARDALSLWLET